MQWIQSNDVVQSPISHTFYKIFIVLSKKNTEEIEKKIANLIKKDTIAYIQEEFEKSWKWFVARLNSKI